MTTIDKLNALQGNAPKQDRLEQYLPAIHAARQRGVSWEAILEVIKPELRYESGTIQAKYYAWRKQR